MSAPASGSALPSSHPVVPGQPHSVRRIDARLLLSWSACVRRACVMHAVHPSILCVGQRCGSALLCVHACCSHGTHAMWRDTHTFEAGSRYRPIGPPPAASLIAYGFACTGGALHFTLTWKMPRSASDNGPPPVPRSLESTLRAGLQRFATMGMKKNAGATRDWTTPALQSLLLQDKDVAAHPEAVVRPNNTFFQLTAKLVYDIFGVTQVTAGSDFRQSQKLERRRHLSISSPHTKLWVNLQALVSHRPPTLTLPAKTKHMSAAHCLLFRSFLILGRCRLRSPTHTAPLLQRQSTKGGPSQ